MINSKKKNLDILLILSISFFAIFIRSYNINYDNYWFDEILSFWITDPNIPLQESFKRHKSVEQIPFLYHFFLKLIYKFFSYDYYYGRYLSLIFNILGILFATLTCKLISNNKSYLLALFLFSTNIFLINYSQELRPYSLIFFLCSLNLYLFFKIYNNSQFQIFSSYLFCLISISQILMIISHPFSIIIFFSTSLFLVLNFINKRKNPKTLVYSTYFCLVFLAIYLFFYLNNLNSFPSWIQQPDFKFFTNFYFSKFFGSRIMGLFHLILLIYFIFLNLKSFTIKNNNLNLLIIIIILSYLLPLTYGYLFNPIIFPRYIIFILMPIIVVISIMIFDIKNKILRNIIFSIIIILNIGNHFSESTFKQFYLKRPNYKPDFDNMINLIVQSRTQIYTINMSVPIEKERNVYAAIDNYISILNVSQNSEINFFKKDEFFKSKNQEIWVICLPDVVMDKCRNFTFNKDIKIIDEKYVPGIKLSLIKKIQ